MLLTQKLVVSHSSQLRSNFGSASLLFPFCLGAAQGVRRLSLASHLLSPLSEPLLLLAKPLSCLQLPCLQILLKLYAPRPIERIRCRLGDENADNSCLKALLKINPTFSCQGIKAKAVMNFQWASALLITSSEKRYYCSLDCRTGFGNCSTR